MSKPTTAINEKAIIAKYIEQQNAIRRVRARKAAKVRAAEKAKLAARKLKDKELATIRRLRTRAENKAREEKMKAEREAREAVRKAAEEAEDAQQVADHPDWPHRPVRLEGESYNDYWQRYDAWELQINALKNPNVRQEMDTRNLDV
jgi:hypothetical protein